jgi:hypothetical protein
VDHQPGNGAPCRLNSMIDQRITLWSARMRGNAHVRCEGRRRADHRRIIGYRNLAKLVIAIERRHATLTAANARHSEPRSDTDTPTTEESTLIVTV